MVSGAFGHGLACLVDSGTARDVAGSSPVVVRAVLESGDGWLATVKSEKYWSEKRSSGGAVKPSLSQAPRSFLGGPSRTQTAAKSSKSNPERSTDSPLEPDDMSGATWHSGDDDNYRTVCVRLCDGYQWPISFSTTDDRFEDDEKKCQQSCSSPTRLFVVKTPTDPDDELKDLKGLPYKRLKTANLFRTAFVENCKCRAHPWEQQAIDRHRMYAADAKRKSGDAVAAAEFERLKSSLAVATAADRKLAAVALSNTDLFETEQGGTKSKAAAAPPMSKPAIKVATRNPTRTANDDDYDVEETASTPRSRSKKKPVVTASTQGAKPSVTVMRLGGSLPTSARATVASRPPARSVQRASNADWKKAILAGGSVR
jgi:hypothetical protein